MLALKLLGNQKRQWLQGLASASDLFIIGEMAMFKNQRKERLFLACITALGVSAGSIAARAELPELQTYGTYSELSARWWQWALSVPAASNPIVDATGEFCAEGQFDDVYFLAGTFSGETLVERECTIPASNAGKPIFFPILNSVAFKPTGKDFQTLNEIRAALVEIFDNNASISCKVNDDDCTYFRVKSPSFTVLAPQKGLVPPGQLRTPGKGDVLVAEGYWVLIPPLEDGGQISIDAKITDALNNTLVEVKVNYSIKVE